MTCIGYAYKRVKGISKVEILKKALMIVGMTVTMLVIFVGLLIGAAAIERAITTPHLNSGRIVNKCYNDGHTTYDIWKIGDLSLVKKNEKEPYYYFEVTDGKVSDFWTVSVDEWSAASVGDSVTR